MSFCVPGFLFPSLDLCPSLNLLLLQTCGKFCLNLLLGLKSCVCLIGLQKIINDFFKGAVLPRTCTFIKKLNPTMKFSCHSPCFKEIV